MFEDLLKIKLQLIFIFSHFNSFSVFVFLIKFGLGSWREFFVEGKTMLFFELDK